MSIYKRSVHFLNHFRAYLEKALMSYHIISIILKFAVFEVDESHRKISMK